jgi:putative glutamine amidotransferase
MTKKPLIGLSGRRGVGEMLGAPRGFSDAPLDIYMSEYATSVQRAGGVPVHVALDSVAAEIVEHLDAVVFSGGEDVDPRRYGAAPGPHTAAIDPHRDSFELELFHAAMARGLPILGICRGAQLINVARGGSLIQHLQIGTGESHASYAYPRAHRVHAVSLEAGSTAAAFYGASVTVNSFHHQAVDRPGDGVIVTGRADDGVVESFELAGLPVLGVQWHPEVFGGDPIFDWLLDSVRTRTGQASATLANPTQADTTQNSPRSTTGAEEAA